MHIIKSKVMFSIVLVFVTSICFSGSNLELVSMRYDYRFSDHNLSLVMFRDSSLVQITRDGAPFFLDISDSSKKYAPSFFRFHEVFCRESLSDERPSYLEIDIPINIPGEYRVENVKRSTCKVVLFDHGISLVYWSSYIKNEEDPQLSRLMVTDIKVFHPGGVAEYNDYKDARIEVERLMDLAIKNIENRLNAIELSQPTNRP